ncbi:DUF6455 family protein [Neorhizobium alkalisoli]|uniref:DUF6455 domain-containing protein n=1 Tax=Neorhizobium alkalisoli TaxID=528178 RepID=A0A561R291_9HYPH|nr:DUF6455 family protein [Neorhizobium alkalisoli]TWF56683.1 hypothetical protein FHW37_102321 [Neorhizobium alkalisoli]
MTQAVNFEQDGLGLRFLRWCGRAFEAASEADAIAMLDEDTVRKISHEFSITPDDLMCLAQAGPHAADELLAMMRALNVDSAEVARIHPALFREMQISCSRCSHKALCRADLSAGQSRTEFSHYCGNTDALNALRAEPDVLIG